MKGITMDTNVGAVILILLYLIPGLVALKRNHRNRNAIGVLNLLLGWTVLGWIVALVWANTADVEPRQTGSINPPGA
jgi:Superinfection immunity protein